MKVVLGVVGRTRCIPSLTTIQRNRNSLFPISWALSNMNKPRRYHKLRRREGRDLGKAGGHEKKRASGNQSALWKRCCWCNGTAFERDGFRTNKGVVEIYGSVTYETLHKLYLQTCKMLNESVFTCVSSAALSWVEVRQYFGN